MQGKLIKSFFRKDMSHMVSFMLLIILTSLMLQLGLCLWRGYDEHFARRAEELNASDIWLYTNVFPGEYTYEEVMAPVFDYLDSCDGIDHYECSTVDVMKCIVVDEETGNPEVDDMNTNSLGFAVYEDQREMNIPDVVEEAQGEFEHPLYISYDAKNGVFHGNYNVGDEVAIKVGGVEIPFVIKGIYETLGDDDIFYTDRSTYSEISGKTYYKCYNFFLRLNEGVDIEEYTKKLNEDISSRQLYLGLATLPVIITDYTYMISIISSILCIFSIIVTLVIFVVIYFRISNSIEQNIVNLGALKALGYTGGQIRTAYVTEFTLTSAVGLLISTAVLYAGFPYLESILRTLTESRWDHPFNMTAFLITALFIAGSTLLVAFFSASRIKSIEPVTALRFGLKSHSFKKNSFPIETTPGPLLGIMSLKGSFGNRKQGALITAIMTVVGITLAVAVFVGYNVVSKPMNLYKLLMGSSYDVELYLREEEDINDILSIEGVEKAWAEDSIYPTLKGTKLFADTTEDWTKAEISLVDGRVPIYINEVVLGSTVARANDIRIGDEVELTANGKTLPFVVTGLMQSVIEYGNVGILTNEAAKSLDEYISNRCVRVIVKDSDLDTSYKVISEAEAMFGENLFFYNNLIESVETGEETYVETGKIICIGLVVVAVIVVLLSMVLLVKTIIIKHQRELGIKKALGFTSSQLRFELTFSMMPHIILGLLIGSLAGGINSNRLLDFLLSGFGVAQSNLEFAYWMPVLSIVFGTLVSFVIIYLLSGRIRKITAYSLMSE